MIYKNELEQYLNKKIESMRIKDSNTFIVRLEQHSTKNYSIVMEIDSVRYNNWLRRKKLLKLIK